MISVLIKDIPYCYKNSVLYRELIQDEKSEITLYEKYYLKDNPERILWIDKDLSKFDKALEHIRYWMFDKFPEQIYKFVEKNINYIETEEYKNVIKKYHDIPFIKGLSFKYKNYNQNLANYIVDTNDVNLFQYLVKHQVVLDKCTNPSIGLAFINNLIKHNRMDILKLAFENDYVVRSVYFRQAARYGNLELLKHLYSLKDISDGEILANAAIGNNLECFKYAYGKGERLTRDYQTRNLQSLIGKTGNVEFLKFAYKNNLISNDISISIGKSGSLDAIKYMISNNKLTINFNLFRSIIESGNLESVLYMYNNYKSQVTPFNSSIKERVIKSNNVEILKFFISLDTNFDFGSHDFIEASEYNRVNLDFFKLLYKHTECKPAKLLEKIIYFKFPIEHIKFILEERLGLSDEKLYKIKERFWDSYCDNDDKDDLFLESVRNIDDWQISLDRHMTEKGKMMLDKYIKKVRHQLLKKVRKNVFSTALRVSDLETIKFLKKYNLPTYDNCIFVVINRLHEKLHKHTYRKQITDDSLKILNFLVKNGYKLSEECMELIFEYDIYDDIKYIIPKVDNTNYQLYKYIKENDLDGLRSLICNLDRVKLQINNKSLTLRACKYYKDDQMLVYLHDNFGLTNDIYRYAIENDSVTLIKIGLQLKIPKIIIKCNEYYIPPNYYNEDNYIEENKFKSMFYILYKKGFILDKDALDMCIEDIEIDYFTESDLSDFSDVSLSDND